MPLTEFAAESGTALDSQVDAPVDQFMVIDLALIVASNTNPRTVFNLPRLEELATSIRASGVHQPVLVRPLPASRLQETFDGFRRGERPAYELIAGERRFRASKLASVDSIPAMIRHLTDEQVLEIQLVENLQRDDLHPMEEAEGYEKLIQVTHVTKEELGEKIGKSRAYVYGRLKLLDLGQDARKAFYEGHIDSSRALVIARIPDAKLQLKALEEAKAEDYQGGLRHNFKSFVRWAQQNVMLRLDAARFKITDASLVPDAGSCKECPKRTGAQPEVFADVDSADVCIDPACFHAKEAAHEEIVIAEAKKKGQRIITEREAKKLWSWEFSKIDGFVRADRPDDRVGGSKMLKTILGKDAPEPILMQNPHKDGELIEVYPADKVSKLLKEAGRITPQQARSDRPISAEEAKRNALAKYEKTWRKRAIAAIAAKMASDDDGGGVSARVCRLIASELLGGLRGDERQHMCELLGLGKIADREAIEAYLKDCTESQAEQAMHLLLVQQDMLQLVSYSTGGAIEAERLAAVADDYAVDLPAIKEAVKDELAEAARPKAKAQKTEDSAPTSAKSKSGKKSSAPPAAPKKRGGKPSAEEVQAQIAEQLQQLDQAPDGAGQEVAAEAAQEPIQAPGGAAEEVGAAPAAPAAPTLQVGDRITVTDSKYTQFEEQGEITHVLAKSKVRVAFDKGPDAVLPAAAVQVTAKALWPFPTESTAPVKDAPATFSLGQLVKVKAGSKSAGGKALKTVGKVGRVAGLGDDGRVHLRHGPRSHELVVVQPEQLEPYSAALQVVIGSKVRIHPKGFLESRNKLAWREGTVDACTDDGWRVTISATAKDAELVDAFDTAELEVLA